MLTRLLAVALVTIATTGAAHAVSFETITPATSTKLFTTEMKRDKGGNNSQSGHDIFPRNGDSFATPVSYNFNWGDSGTTYDWEMFYDGDDLSFTFDGRTETLDINPDGDWNAITIFLRSTDAGRLESSKVTLVVDEANGSALDTALVTMAALGDSGGGFFEDTFALVGGGGLSSISGSLTFDFLFKSGQNGSPNSQLAANIKALSVQPVPLPAALPMLIGGIAAIGLVARRRRQRA